MKVAVVILNYNSSDDCRKCVSFLKRQEGAELELIIVDNCSPDADKVKDLCLEQGCTFISSKENRGYNAGNNIGLRYAAGKGYKYALIANPDMEFPQTDYVARLVEVMERDNDIVVAGSDIIGADGKHQSPMHKDGNWKSSFGWITEPFKKISKDTYDFIDNYKEDHYCAKVSGCCLMVRMDFIESIGYFDEYPFLYCEEAILSRQVEIAGKKMYYLSSAQAVHRHIASKKGDPARRFREWERSRIYFIKKYSIDMYIGKIISIISLCTYLNLLIGFSLLKNKFTK